MSNPELQYQMMSQRLACELGFPNFTLLLLNGRSHLVQKLAAGKGATEVQLEDHSISPQLAYDWS